MSFELYGRIFDGVKEGLVMAVLHVKGEPLHYRHPAEATTYASDRLVAAMIPTSSISMSQGVMGPPSIC